MAQDDDAIRNAVLRYEIGHPCVNDANMILWRDLGIASWPTLALVSPRGRLLTLLPGEAACTSGSHSSFRSRIRISLPKDLHSGSQISELEAVLVSFLSSFFRPF